MLRKYRMNLARKTNTFDNLTDCITRLYMNSHPMVRSLKPKKRNSPPSTKPKFLYKDHEMIELFLDE